jgi:hypothetical protein
MAPAMVEGSAGAFSATPSEYVKQSESTATEGVEGAVLNPFVENYAAITISGLNAINAPGANPQEFVPYVSQFDPALASKLLSTETLTPSDIKNISLIRRLETQELQIRAKRDEAIARDILVGEFGQNFRRARADAYANYGTKMAAMWMTTAGSIAVGGAMLQSAGSAAAVLAANNSTFDSFNRAMETQGLEYVNRLAPSLIGLGQASLGLLDNSVKVMINDQAGLRAALTAIYQKRRSKN